MPNMIDARRTYLEGEGPTVPWGAVVGAVIGGIASKTMRPTSLPTRRRMPLMPPLRNSSQYDLTRSDLMPYTWISALRRFRTRNGQFGRFHSGLEIAGLPRRAEHGSGADRQQRRCAWRPIRRRHNERQ